MDATLPVNTSTPQVLTTVVVNGNQMVSFDSGIDWADAMTLNCESPDAEQCIKRVSDWLSGLDIYPWGNLADCQEYANVTQSALTDPLIYQQIRDYVYKAHQLSFTYLPMAIGYLTIAFTFRRVDLTYELPEETIEELAEEAELYAAANLAATTEEEEMRAQAQANALKLFNFDVNIQSKVMPFLVADYTNKEGELIKGDKKPELRGELKNSTVTELLSFLLTVGTNITAPDSTTTVSALAQHTQALSRLKNRFFDKLPKVGSTFTENCEVVVSDEEHGLCIRVRVNLIN